MKKIIVFLITAALLFCGFNSTTVNATQVSDKNVYVPLRVICEAIGANINYDKDVVTVKKDNNILTLRLKNGSAEINGKKSSSDNKIQIVNNRVKVPLELINNAFSPKLTTEDTIKIIAVKYVELLKNGDVYDCKMLYNASLNEDITPDAIKAYGTAVFKPLGELKPLDISLQKNAIHNNVILSYNTSISGAFTFTVRFDSNMQIADYKLNIIPEMPYKAPLYDIKNSYTEKEVVIGDGKWKLPGILTVPEGKGPFPVVVLVHGSGPNDMDETMGPLKPFEDIAVGLASKNIAVLRYNKRSFEYNASYAAIKKATVKDEVIDDTFAAINYLAALPQIDTSRIFVLGHSQGAMLMPRIISADKKGLIKGAVMMSGNSRPLQDVTMDQYRYFYKLGQLNKEQLDYYINQYSMINNPDFSAGNTPKGFALGGTYWWADLKAYNQVEVAKQLNTPLLIMQGARDYQVLAAKDFQGWKDALSNKPNVSFKLYPKLNHMYTEGEGGELSTNMEYFNQANIPGYVIDDIINWIGSQK